MEIPPALDTDAEDVVWALQTAASLWKRNERADAVVWLRRAAQAAGEALADDRALALARLAAELSDGLAHAPVVQGVEPSASSVEIPISVSGVELPVTRARESAPSVDPHRGMLDPWAQPPPLPQRDSAAPDTDDVVTSAPRLPASEPAREVSQSAVPTPARPPPPLPRKPPPPLPPPQKPPAAQKKLAARRPRKEELPPLSSESRTPSFVDEGEKLYVADPATLLRATRRSVRPAPPPAATGGAVADVATTAAVADARPPVEPGKVGGLVLDGVSAFADLPDDERAALAASAIVCRLHVDEEVGQFDLALVVVGEVDVTAQIVDAPADRLCAGTVLRTKGTLADAVTLRLVCATADATVAMWNAEQVEHAFTSCPWVEADLRAQADRVQALVGVTFGPLAERLDADLRRQVTSRLAVREVAEGEVVFERGGPVKQLLIVGQGRIDVLDGTDVKGTVGPGELLFASEILGGGMAPGTARAGKGGALVLWAERSVAQELMVTCPPLLEILGGT